MGLIDLYPTLTDLCGLPPNLSNQGRSLKPLLTAPDAKWRNSVLTTYARGNHSIRTERYRYIRYEDGSEELYDHSTDPHEWQNLAGNSDHSQLIERLRREIPTKEAAYHKATRGGAVNQWFDDHLRKNGVKGGRK